MSGEVSRTSVSADGSRIAWTQQGEGPAIVMVGGVMSSRSRPQQPGLASALSSHYRVLSYDRRGTGESRTEQPYSVEREFEDLNCMLGLVGPGASVYGFSSGATLALLAADAGVGGSQLLLVEPPLISDPDLGPLEEAERRLHTDRATAREWFDVEITGIPAEIRAQFSPLTDEDIENASTMLHELRFLPGTTARQFAALRTPALLMASDHTAPNLLGWARELGGALPDVDLRILPGQWHGIADDVIVETIDDFLESRTTSRTAGRTTPQATR